MNPARPALGTQLFAVGDLDDGEGRAFDFRSGEALFSIIAIRRGAAIIAYENDCPHARQPLERFDGRVVMVEQRYIICAAHGASFRIADGVCVGGPAKGALTPFAVVVRDGAVFAA
ncbi:MAG: Rieske 2Fe-2S domain-containing protein [Hyphomonadaceae bacterium]|nr:Rieske 2Fe-2S domain-containing protein [Hyphomonadaceae bacterium]